MRSDTNLSRCRSVSSPDKPKRLCSVDSCGRQSRARGLCGAHFQRLNLKGDVQADVPLRKQAEDGAPLAFALWAVANATPSECVKWPFANTNGYGSFRGVAAHRFVCEQKHGPPPTPDHQAAHNCGKGREGCINPHHLRWATRSENSADKWLHGTMPFGEWHMHARLTEADVLYARREHTAGRATKRALANKFGVAWQTIDYAIRGVNWGWLSDDGSVS